MKHLSHLALTGSAAALLYLFSTPVSAAPQ